MIVIGSMDKFTDKNLIILSAIKWSTLSMGPNSYNLFNPNPNAILGYQLL